MSLLDSLKNIVEAQLTKMSDTLRLAQLEAKLAVRTTIQLVILSFIALFFALSTWLILNVACYMYFVDTLHYSPFVTAISMTGLHLFILLSLLITMLRLKRNLFFSGTRQQFKRITQKETAHE